MYSELSVLFNKVCPPEPNQGVFAKSFSGENTQP